MFSVFLFKNSKNLTAVNQSKFVILPLKIFVIWNWIIKII